MWISSGQCKWGLSIENEANSNSQLLMFSTSGNISLPHFFCLWWWSLLCTVCFSVIYVSLECILYWWFWLMIPALRLIKTHRLCWPSAKPLALGGNIKTHAICWQNTSAALKQPHCAKKASLSYIQKKKKHLYNKTVRFGSETVPLWLHPTVGSFCWSFATWEKRNNR